MRTMNDGGTAFPIVVNGVNEFYYGMSMRDYFAAKAMQGYLAGMDHNYSVDKKGLSEKCYDLADAMIEEREK